MVQFMNAARDIMVLDQASEEEEERLILDISSQIRIIAMVVLRRNKSSNQKTKTTKGEWGDWVEGGEG